MASAFSPGNITLFFGIVKNKDPMKMCSIGVSFAVSRGAWAIAKRSEKMIIRVDGRKKRFPTVKTALNLLSGHPVEVAITTELPLGCGYGMSGACALAAVLAANKELGLKNSRKALALLAHRAEVMHKTGLGSVTAEYLGGFLVREKKGKPLAARKIDVPKRRLFYASLGPISTMKTLTDPKMAGKINRSCRVAFRKFNSLENTPSYDSIFRIGKEFASAAGLLKDPKLISSIKDIESKGGSAAMNMLGKSIISTIPFNGSKVLQSSRLGARVMDKPKS
ncbi:hypothetical protein HYU13_00420 [Candidatus Woesearchaeota archaeon]|nr:hypothetical protein [Candidatus Woesearchaeota archaeon]